MPGRTSTVQGARGGGDRGDGAGVKAIDIEDRRITGTAVVVDDTDMRPGIQGHAPAPALDTTASREDACPTPSYF